MKYVQRHCSNAQAEDELAREPIENMWSFSATSGQAQQMSVRDVQTFLEGIIQAHEHQLLITYGISHPMLFYCWFDELAVQLRLSLISATHQSLPFGCRVNIVNDIQCIISKFLTSLYHDGIPWDEFYSVELPQEEVTRPIYTLDVWMTRLPSTITEQA